MKLIFFIISAIPIAASLNLQAQKLFPQVISSAGSHATGNGVQLSWTVGEPVISTLFSGNYILTQGFHQSKLEVTALDNVLFPELEISLFPNPVSGSMKLEVKGKLNFLLSCQLFDTQGRLLFDKKVEILPFLFDMESFASGTYFFNVCGVEAQLIKTFKIVKK
jgi:hypothetical protein